MIFEIVNNLNEASEIYPNKKELISLNVNASKVALKNFAFEPALKFSSFAKSLLSKDSWEMEHDITFEVYLMEANNFFLISKLKEATMVYLELIEKSNTKFETLKAIVSYSRLLLLESNFGDALKLFFQVASIFEISKDVFTQNREEFDLWGISEINQILEFFDNINDGKTFKESIPTNANEEMSLFSKYLLQSSSVFFQTSQCHFSLATQILGMKIGISEGYSETLPAIMSCFSWYSEFYFLSQKTSIVGKISRDMKSYIKNPSIYCFLEFYQGICACFESNASDAMKYLELSYHNGYGVGEYNWGSYSAYCWMNCCIANGCNFENVQKKSIAAQNAVYGAKHPFIGDMIESSIQTIKIITGESNKFEPNHIIPVILDVPFSKCNYITLKSFSLYLLRDFSGAYEALKELSKNPNENIGLNHHYEVPMYTILIHFELFKASSIEHEFCVKIINENVEILEKYSKINPMYFQCRYLFSKAILESLTLTNEFNIFCTFDDAVKDASTCNCSWIEALATEYFSYFCKTSSRFQDYSNHLIQQAFRKWKAMGANVFADRLLDLVKLQTDQTSSVKSLSFGTTTSSNSVFSLDLESIIKSSNTISEDLDKKKLLSKLNHVIMENAGANKAFIILKENNKFIVNSEIRNDKIFESMEIIDSGCKSISVTIFNQCLNQQDIIIYRNALNENNFKLDQYIQNNSVKSVLCAPIIKGKKISGVLYLENNTMEGAFTESRKFILKHILSQVAISIENSTLYEDVKKINQDIITINEAYSRFLPTEFLKQLEKKDVRNVQPSDSIEKNMTILFSDIRNFTNITDSMDAKESFIFINEILNELAPPIRHNDGFVDKFIGDCVMAIFPNSPLDAVKSGVQMLNSLKKLNQNRKIPVNIGVGIAYGSVMMGTLGYEKRLDATVISSTVNTASRMESLTKSLGVSLLITEEVFNEIKTSQDIFCHFLGSFYLKGQKDPKKLFNVSEKKDQFNSFDKGLTHFQQKEFKEAKEVFDLNNSCPISKYYSRVCELYSLNRLPNDWKGEIKISKDGDPQQIISESEDVDSIDKISIIQNSMADSDQLNYLYQAALILQNKI
jgi:class 3 adenylate cyclase